MINCLIGTCSLVREPDKYTGNHSAESKGLTMDRKL